MAASARRIRSQASPASHPERQQETRRAAARPELHVVKSEQADVASSQNRFRSFIEWTRSHTVPVIQVGIARVPWRDCGGVVDLAHPNGGELVRIAAD